MGIGGAAMNAYRVAVICLFSVIAFVAEDWRILFVGPVAATLDLVFVGGRARGCVTWGLAIVVGLFALAILGGGL
jgi:hypothetical protein